MGTQTEEIKTELSEMNKVRFNSIDFLESYESDQKPADSDCNVNHDGGSVSVMRNINPIPSTKQIV